LATGGDVVDADVWMSADGVPVAIHDSTLERTTNGSGRVADTTAADMGALDAGWGFERDGEHPFRGLGITIPTIEQILTTFPTRLITLDLKDLRVELVAPVCELLTRFGRTQDVYVGVDTSEQVLQFRKTCPDVHTSGTDEERAVARAARDAGDTTFVTHQLVGQPGFLGSDGKKRITAKFLEFSHMNDIAVLTWVVDDPDDISDLIDMGIDGIYTRRPDVMIKLLQEKGLLPAA
jgi:glycerophosphoryl diester phosphodiesterase